MDLTAAGNIEATLSRHYYETHRRLLGRAALPTNKLKAILAARKPVQSTATFAALHDELTDTQVAAVQRVLDKFGFTWAEMTGKNGPRQMKARAIVVALMRDWGLSFTAIGRLLGRNHCTIVLNHQRHGAEAARSSVYFYAKSCV